MVALAVLLAGCTPAETACNGHDALCDRRFSEVTFPGAHNAMSAIEDGFTLANANHQRGLDDQLAAGIRVMLLDVTYGPDDETALCHGPCELGLIPHLDGLAVLAGFIEEHPREVLTIVYQDSVSTDDLAADFATAGLDEHTYTHPTGAPWPTLRALIDAKTTLVVTAESGGPPPAWLHHVWDEAWDTPYSFETVDDFSCALNRGDTGNPLFQINHWLSTELGLPSETRAVEGNSFEVLDGRARQCWEASGQQPNFLVVDWWETGDLFAVVDGLNGL
jgi:hypothetical protein